MTGHEIFEENGRVSSPIACFRCGICCTEYQVNLSLEEGQRIAGELGITWEAFLDSYVDKSWPGIRNFLLCKRNGACVFLERVEGSRVTSCRIHSFRPSSCIDWVPGLFRWECQKGLADYWGLAVSPSGHLQGSAQKVREFHELLESLAN